MNLLFQKLREMILIVILRWQSMSLITKKLESYFICRIKFGLSEKHTKFEKNLPRGFDKSADLLRKRKNHEEDFFKLCVFQKV